MALKDKAEHCCCDIEAVYFMLIKDNELYLSSLAILDCSW